MEERRGKKKGGVVLGQAPSACSGQATLELAVAMLMVILLLIALVKIFLWLNMGIVKRQVTYENTRVAAGSAPRTGLTIDGRMDNEAAEDLIFSGEVYVNEPFETLNLFN